MPAYAVSQTTIGLGKEVTRGTAVASSAWAKVKAPKYVPTLTIIDDDTLQGSAVVVYQQSPGMRYDAHGWDSFPYMDNFPLYVQGELGSSDTYTAAPSNTTLSAANAAGATTISTAATIAANSWITLGTGGTLETHYTTAVSGGGPFTVTTQYPLLYAHPTGTTVTGLSQHVFSLLNNAGTGNQPPSFTLNDYDGEEWRQLTAAQLDKLTIKGQGAGYVDYSATWFANASVTPSPPTASFTSTPLAPPGWTTLIAINGTPIQYVEDWEIDLARQVKPIPALTGTQAYYQYFAGPLTATGKITVVEQSGAPELTKYLNGTQGALDITVYDTSSGFGMRMHSTTVGFKTGALERSKEWVEATLDIQLIPTATDATAGGVSPINISFGNGQASQY